MLLLLVVSLIIGGSVVVRVGVVGCWPAFVIVVGGRDTFSSCC